MSLYGDNYKGLAVMNTKETTMNEQERYEQVCQPQLDRLEANTDKILSIIQGNGSTGMLTIQATHAEKIVNLENSFSSLRSWLIGTISSILVILTASGIAAIVIHLQGK
jgi:hypothetical protein